jgi:hypothetical protein
MSLDKSSQYYFRIGSDNQHRVHWDGKSWHYEFIAGGVLFDEQFAESEQEISEMLFVHGLTLDRFSIDLTGAAQKYSQEIHQKNKELTAKGIDPCPKHGMMAKNPDGTCEACQHTDYWDDFKGQEG